MWAKLREVRGDLKEAVKRMLVSNVQNQPSWEESICKGARPCLLRMSMSRTGRSGDRKVARGNRGDELKRKRNSHSGPAVPEKISTSLEVYPG